MTHDDVAIGIDLGGTKIEIALVDCRGNIKMRIRRLTDVTGGYAAVKEQIVAAARQILKDIDFPLRGIGVGIAGQVQPETGVVVFAPNLRWNDAPLRSDLTDSLGLPVAITNDVRAASLGEWIFGAGRGCNDLVAVFVGTGIGGGVISGGRVLSGCSNTFGEIGHMTVDLDGPACRCGNRGCLEALAGGWAIGRQAREAVNSNPPEGEKLLALSGGRVENVSARTVVEALRQNDRLARKIMQGAVEALTAASVGIVNAFNPCRLILGGGVVEGFPELVEQVEKGVRQRALEAATAKLEVMRAYLGKDAGVIGAAAFALNQSDFIPCK
jgi:glucokinase